MRNRKKKEPVAFEVIEAAVAGHVETVCLLSRKAPV